MKLIIDIPEEMYEFTKSARKARTYNAEDYVDLILNGTPLDDVKAEIDEQYDRVRPYNIDVAQGLEMALDILDNIGKAESEDKEAYGFCAYHEIECDYDGQCTECPHNTEEDTEWFKQDEEQGRKRG